MAFATVFTARTVTVYVSTPREISSDASADSRPFVAPLVARFGTDWTGSCRRAVTKAALKSATRSANVAFDDVTAAGTVTV